MNETIETVSPAEAALRRIANDFLEVRCLLDDLEGGAGGSGKNWLRGRVSGYLFALLIAGQVPESEWRLACEGVRLIGRAQS